MYVAAAGQTLYHKAYTHTHRDAHTYIGAHRHTDTHTHTHTHTHTGLPAPPSELCFGFVFLHQNSTYNSATYSLFSDTDMNFL